MPIPGKLWAYVRQLSATEYWPRKCRTRKKCSTVNWRPDITPQMYIEYKGVWYDIKRVDTFEGYKENLHLYASQTLRSPDPDDTPYGHNPTDNSPAARYGFFFISTFMFDNLPGIKP